MKNEPVPYQKQTSMKLPESSGSPPSLTCDQLSEQLVVAVDDVDGHVSGRLQ